MTVGLYGPRDADDQTPHAQGELYIVQQGRGTFVKGAEPTAIAAGSVLFVPAGRLHRFEDLSSDFVTWGNPG